MSTLRHLRRQIGFFLAPTYKQGLRAHFCFFMHARGRASSRTTCRADREFTESLQSQHPIGERDSAGAIAHVPIGLTLRKSSPPIALITQGQKIKSSTEFAESSSENGSRVRRRKKSRDRHLLPRVLRDNGGHCPVGRSPLYYASAKWQQQQQQIEEQGGGEEGGGLSPSTG